MSQLLYRRTLSRRRVAGSIIFGFALVTSLIAAPTAADQDRATKLRVVAYNVACGQWATPEQIAAALKPLNPDIVLLSEVPKANRGKNVKDWSHRLAEKLDLDHVHVGTVSSANHKAPKWGDVTGNYGGKFKSVLSRTPLTEGRDFLPEGSGWRRASAVRVETEIGGRKFALYSLHLPGYAHHKRQQISADAWEGTKHRSLAEIINAEDASFDVIVGGDFNEWTDGVVMRSLLKTTKLENAITSRSIDHILYSTARPIKLLEVKRDWGPQDETKQNEKNKGYLSDHPWVYCEFEIPAGTSSEFVIVGQNESSQEQDHYPKFSWNHVPRYMHMRKSKAFTKKEFQYLAKFPIITLEKKTGMGTYGSTEQGSLEAAKGIKAINPDAKVLYYRNIIVHYNGYDVNKSLSEIDSPLLINAAGKTNIIHGGKRGGYDLTSSSLQSWWLDHCIAMAANAEINGIFIDGNIKVLEPAFLKKEIGQKKKAKVAKAYEQMMRDLKSRLGKDKLVIANIIRARLSNSGLDYLEYFDGSYLEGIEVAANGMTRLDYVARGIAAIQKAARDGKIICFSMGLGEAKMVGMGIDDTRIKVGQGSAIQNRLTYTLAMFLVCAEKYSYFLAHDGYSVNRKDSSVWLKDFPEYSKPLGPPKGPAKKKGYIYSRDYEYASVWLDIENEKARIEWRSGS